MGISQEVCPAFLGRGEGYSHWHPQLWVRADRHWHHGLQAQSPRPSCRVCCSGEAYYLLKMIPHVDGSPRICELVDYRLEDIVMKGAWTGPATLELEPHALAPIRRLAGPRDRVGHPHYCRPYAGAGQGRIQLSQGLSSRTVAITPNDRPATARHLNRPRAFP